MKKGLIYIFIFLTLLTAFLPVHSVQACIPGTCWITNNIPTFPSAGELIFGILQVALLAILKLLSWLTGFAGLLLNYVINYTITDFAKNIKDFTGINNAWVVLRDIMNIFFIFILIYEGILLIIGQGNTANIRKFIVGFVLASILINFSLFFTKIMIDASNTITIGIYNSILGPVTVQQRGDGYGLSDPIMQRLGIQKVYDVKGGDASFGAGKSAGGLLIMFLGSATVIIVSSFIFFAVAIMFIIRYTSLLILLMFSPVAYMGMALPFMQSTSRTWWDSFKSQLLFPPVFMLMLWVVMTLMSSPNFITASTTVGGWSGLFSSNADGPATFSMMGLVLNFSVVISLLIATLTVSKDVANKGSKMISQATSSLTGFASTAVFGASAWAGRNTAGALGNMATDSAALQNAANKERSGIWGRTAGAASRATLWGAEKARDATWDARNASIPTSVIGDLTRGTVGRTKAGKALGLDIAETSSIDVGGRAASLTGLGKGATVGYTEVKTANEKKRKEMEGERNEAAESAKSRAAILAGKNFAVGTNEYDAMEKALSKQSDKQAESLVASNKSLLESQHFANALSVKQLQALSKSDLLSDQDKAKLKQSRFTEINTAMEALMNPTLGPRTAAQTAAIDDLPNQLRNNIADAELSMLDPAYFKDPVFAEALKTNQVDSVMKGDSYTSKQKADLIKSRFAALSDPDHQATLTMAATARPSGSIEAVRYSKITKSIKGLSDSELDMIDPSLLAKPEIVGQLRAPQVETLGKSLRLTPQQKDAFRDARKQPLLAAMAMPTTTPAEIDAAEKAAKAAMKSLSHKEMAALVADPAIKSNPLVINTYTKEMLKRMAAEMNPADIPELRDEIIRVAPTSVAAVWLKTKEGKEKFA